MSDLLYEIGIRAYAFLVKLASIKNQKAKMWVWGRKGILQKITKGVNNIESYYNSQRVWIHCASLGEFEQALPLMQKIKEKDKTKIIVTFFSPSGYEVRKNHPLPDGVFYLPIDTRRNAESMIKTIQPHIAIFLKYEFWLNYLKCLHKKKIPSLLISANFRKEQQFFKWYGIWGRKALKLFDHILTRNEESSKLLNELGVYNHSISGDTRYDKVYETSIMTKELPLVEHFKGNEFLLIAGSTWPEDEDVILPTLNKFANEIKIIIAPHEISEQHLNKIEKELDTKTVRYSNINKENSGARVLLIDNIGMLASLYKYSDLSFVGGGFHTGIHNILEPASFGVTAIFGPNYQRFPEAHELLTNNAVYNIRNEDEFEEVLKESLNNKNEIKKRGEACKNYITINKGATEIIYKKYKEMI